MIYETILDTIGHTPIVKLNNVAPRGSTIYAKVESFNPGGSVKDRLALAVIIDAENRGLLHPGDTIVECTSGNVGIALAMVSAARGYNLVAIMSDTYSVERRKLMRSYGARVILFPGERGTSGGNAIADSFAEQFGWFRPRQFENMANPAYHRETTAAEILRDFAGKPLDFFVAGFGTTGTITGVGQMLKLARPDVRVVALEPANAAVLRGDTWNLHRLQGLAPNFVPSILDHSIIDDLVTVDETEARDMARLLAQTEGIFVGLSAGAAAVAAINLAHKQPPGTTILTVFPDTGERYLSTFLTEGMNEGSDEAWLNEFKAGRKTPHERV